MLNVNNIENNTHVRKIIENIEILFNDKGLLNSIINELPLDGRDRFCTATYAHCALKSGGVLIFDNSDWYPASSSFLRGKKYTQVDFCGFGPINNYT